MLTEAAAGAGERTEGGRRRSSVKRTKAVTPVRVVQDPGWTERLAAPMRAVSGPTRQIWLATLGGAALTVQGVAAVWGVLVAEGTVVEQAIRERAQLMRQFSRFTAAPTRRRS